MDFEKIIHAINQTGSELSENCIAAFSQVARIRQVDKDEILIREGQPSNKVFFIAQGSARVYYLKDGKDITDWFAFENDFISSINSFYLETPSEHFVEVLEPGVVLELTKEHVKSLSSQFPEFNELEKKLVTKTMLRLHQRIISIQFETAQQKYLNLLQVRPDIALRVPLTHIASYLGITLETLSRIRNKRI